MEFKDFNSFFRIGVILKELFFKNVKNFFWGHYLNVLLLRKKTWIPYWITFYSLYFKKAYYYQLTTSGTTFLLGGGIHNRLGIGPQLGGLKVN